MKYLFLMSACLVLGACTTHYNDSTTVAYSGISTVRHDLPVRVASRDTQESKYSRRDDQLSHQQFSNADSKNYDTKTKNTAQEQNVQVSTPRARDPEIINREYFSAAKRGGITLLQCV